MARVVHLSLKVEDLEAATRFYQEVFGFKQGGTHRKGQHVSRRMSDGNLDITLMQYDSESAPEADLSGPGPCIHHFGIEVEDRHAFAETVRRHGGEILSGPQELAIKFRTPHGIIAELVDPGAFEPKGPAKS